MRPVAGGCDFAVRLRLKEGSIPEQKTKAVFVKPMLLLPTNALPEGEGWVYEPKLDGYRAIAIMTNGKVHLRLELLPEQQIA